MSRNRLSGVRFLAPSVLCFFLGLFGSPAFGQIAQPPERPEEHHHGHSMDMNVPSGVTDKCSPTFTYADGPHGPSHWEGVCGSGNMQTPIDISQPEEVSSKLLPPLQFKSQPADLDLVNDCNSYDIKARFPPNQWLKVARKPYRLSEIRFHQPGETAVKGKRPVMSLQLLYLSPETNFLIVEVPVVAGKENPVIKTMWEHIPEGGKESKPEGVKIDVMDLLPADHSFYRFPGSLTTPICNQNVWWYLLKNPIEMSQAQIDKYEQYYHDTARPLQPLNGRPVVESK